MFPEDSLDRPRNKKITKAINRLGPVVQIICLICENRSVPAIAGARFVVSDKGDILSPKYAPDITAPAAILGDKSKPVAIPTKAIPSVPATVHELPIPNAAIAQIIHVAK